MYPYFTCAVFFRKHTENKTESKNVHQMLVINSRWRNVNVFAFCYIFQIFPKKWIMKFLTTTTPIIKGTIFAFFHMFGGGWGGGGGGGFRLLPVLVDKERFLRANFSLEKSYQPHSYCSAYATVWSSYKFKYWNTSTPRSPRAPPHLAAHHDLPQLETPRIPSNLRVMSVLTRPYQLWDIFNIAPANPSLASGINIKNTGNFCKSRFYYHPLII